MTVAQDIASMITRRLDLFDENIFNPELFRNAWKQEGVIVAKGKAPEELVVKKRSKKKPGEQLSKLE